MAWENDHCQRICSGNFRNLAMASKASKKLVGAQESTTHSHKGGLRPGHEPGPTGAKLGQMEPKEKHGTPTSNGIWTMIGLWL